MPRTNPPRNGRRRPYDSRRKLYEAWLAHPRLPRNRIVAEMGEIPTGSHYNHLRGCVRRDARVVLAVFDLAAKQAMWTGTPTRLLQELRKANPDLRLPDDADDLVAIVRKHRFILGAFDDCGQLAIEGPRELKTAPKPVTKSTRKPAPATDLRKEIRDALIEMFATVAKEVSQ